MYYDSTPACPHGKLCPCCKECWPKESKKVGIFDNDTGTLAPTNKVYAFGGSKEEKCCESCEGGLINGGTLHLCSNTGCKCHAEKKCASCSCDCHKEGDTCEKCLNGLPLPSSPTWESKEREAWMDECFCEKSTLANPPTLSCKYDKKAVADYWLGRMKALREEAYDEGAAEATMVCNEKTVPMAREEERKLIQIDNKKWAKHVNEMEELARSQALEEAKEMIEKNPMPFAVRSTDYFQGYRKSTEDVLSSLQQLKDKK